MAVSGLSGGAWALVVLVLVPLVRDQSWAFIFHDGNHGQSSPPACRRWHEFDTNVKRLNDMLKSCQKDCNSAQIIECRCLNLITSEVNSEDCLFPAYFISGLEAMNRTLPGSSQTVQKLINKLNFTHQKCKNDTVPLTCHSSVSPQSFLNTMIHVKQLVHSRQVPRHSK